MIDEYVFYEGRLVSFADMVDLERDEIMYGNVFMQETDKVVGGEVLYERIDPQKVRPVK